jgi:hypothetical protein
MLLALIENLRRLKRGPGQSAEWDWEKADAVLQHLHQRTDHPSARTIHKSRLAGGIG